MSWKDYLNKDNKNMLENASDDWIGDTTEHLEKLIKKAEKEKKPEAKKVLNGLLDFLNNNGYLTNDQKKTLGWFYSTELTKVKNKYKEPEKKRSSYNPSNYSS